MTRAEADETVQALEEWHYEMSDYNRMLKVVTGPETRDRAFNRYNAARERLIDRLCGEPATDPGTPVQGGGL